MEETRMSQARDRWLGNLLLIGPALLTIILSAAIAVLTAVSGCASRPDPWQGKPPPHVMTSFPPLYCFARNVAGDEAAVLCLLTTNGPHDYQPTGRDTYKLKNATAFFINGLGL